MTGSDRRIVRDPRPLYVLVQQAILDLIEDRGLQVGSVLPGEPDLARMFSVGRSSIREAMMHLENEGIVERKRGVGTTLTSLAKEPTLGLEVLESLEDLAARQGWKCGTVDVSIEQRVATDEQAKRLSVSPHSTLSAVTRTKTRDGVPFAVMESFVPPRVATMATLQEDFDYSVVALLAAEMKLRFARSEISAMSCTAPLARKLETKRGVPIVVLTELCFGDDELPLVWNVNYFLAGSIRLEMLRKVNVSRGSRLESGNRGSR